MLAKIAPLALVLSLPLSPTVAQDLSDVHLNVLPRTVDEAARIAIVTAPTDDFSAPGAFEELSAGAATVRARNNADAFSQPSANIGFDGELTFKVGNGLFRKIWVSSPSSTLASDGLGPIYNARSCQRCHIKDGRGHPPENASDTAVSMFMRVSSPARPKTELPKSKVTWRPAPTRPMAVSCRISPCQAIGRNTGFRSTMKTSRSNCQTAKRPRCAARPIGQQTLVMARCMPMPCSAHGLRRR